MKKCQRRGKETYTFNTSHVNLYRLVLQSFNFKRFFKKSLLVQNKNVYKFLKNTKVFTSRNEMCNLIKIKCFLCLNLIRLTYMQKYFIVSTKI